jgi:hypothetical protein
MALIYRCPGPLSLFDRHGLRIGERSNERHNAQQDKLMNHFILSNVGTDLSTARVWMFQGNRTTSWCLLSTRYNCSWLFKRATAEARSLRDSDNPAFTLVPGFRLLAWPMGGIRRCIASFWRTSSQNDNSFGGSGRGVSLVTSRAVSGGVQRPAKGSAGKRAKAS